MQRLISSVKVRIADAFGRGQGLGGMGRVWGGGSILFPVLGGGDTDAFALSEFFT